MRKLDPMNFFVIPELREKKTVGQIAQKWGITTAKAEKAVKDGANEELEHTNWLYIAEIISSHHIYDHGIRYYPELRAMEKRLK